MKLLYDSYSTLKTRAAHGLGFCIAVLCVLLMTETARAQSITGKVFRDFNADGVQSTSATSTTLTEPGVAGVIVKAFNASGAQSASTTSGADGTYTLATAGAGPFRVEFSNLMNEDYDAFRGNSSGTSVQFASGGATVNYGVYYPAQYCERRDPPLVTTCFVSINATNTPALQNRPAMVGVPYTVVDTDNTEKDYATVGEIGAAWGLAYNKDTKQIFSSAFTKRHVGFATDGPNAIYITSVTSTSSGNTTPFFNFTTVGGTAVSSTTETHGNDLPSPPASPTNAQLASYDLPAFDAVGKTSLGDVDISDDNKTLYVVNLKDRKLYTIDIATKAVTGVDIPNPGCTTTGTTAGSYRPFAVKYYRGKVYVGVVCTREDLGTTRATYGPTTGLSATVYAVDPAAPSTFNTVLSFPLTYRKSPTNADILPANTTTVARAEYWRPWTSVFQADRDAGGSTVVSYPQAWLTDIEFDVDGDMIVGLRDRFGDQIGFQNRRPIAGNPDLISAISPGEVLRARKCNLTDAQWTLESNGALCGETPSAAQDAEQGPGGGKYYWGDRVQNGANHGMSSQAGLALLPGSGKLAMTAIDPTDIFNTGGIKRLINATGAKDGNATGTVSNPNAGIVLYGNDAFSYGKANGLGDLEVLCAPSPIQIGNRVWIDTNNNGIQDPGEPALAGITVTLKGPGLPAAGATVTTNANGEYYFSNATGTSATGFVYSLTGLTSGSSYSLTFPTSASAGALTLSTKPNSATGSNADAIDTDPNATGLISFTLGQSGQNNFTYDAGYIVVPPCSVSLTVTNVVCNSLTNQFTVTGSVSFTSAGQTITVADGAISTVISATGVSPQTFTLTGANLVSDASSHTLTATSSATASCVASQTYTAPTSCTVALAGLGDYVFLDVNKDGIQDVNDTPIGGVTVVLYINGVASATTTTASSGTATGFYSFTGLTPGSSLSYSVGFTAPAGLTATTMSALGSTTANDSNADPITGRTASVTLAPGDFNPTIDAGYITATPMLSLEKFVDKSRAEKGAILTYTLVLTNTGSVTATTTVQDVLSGGSSYVPNSASAPAGTTFTPGTPSSTWSVPFIGVGQSLSLTFQAKADSSGILYNTASIPGDTARVCTSVPVHMCVGDQYTFTLTAAPGRSSYKWFKDNVEIAGQTTNVLEVTAPGTYSLAVDNVTGKCPDFSCCPFVIVEDSLPKFVATATPATCVGSTPQANGKITLSQFTAGNTYQYSLGTSFNPAASLSGAAQVIPTGGLIASNLASPVAATSYTVRVYNASGCYTDVTVLLLPTVCGCPAEICVPFVIQQTKRVPRIGDAP